MHIIVEQCKCTKYKYLIASKLISKIIVPIMAANENQHV